MKKNSMRFLSFLLLAMMMVSLLAFGVLAEGEGTSTNVAKIGDVGYESLTAALSAAENGKTVTVLNDCVVNGDVTIPTGVTLNTNGKKVTVDGAVTNLGTIAVNGGELKVTSLSNMAELVIPLAKSFSQGVARPVTVAFRENGVTGEPKYTKTYTLGANANKIVEIVSDLEGGKYDIKAFDNSPDAPNFDNMVIEDTITVTYGTVDVNKGVLTVTNEINVYDGAVNFTGASKLNLEGATLNGYLLIPNAELTVTGGKIINKDSSKSGIEINAGELILNNVEIQSARHAIRIDGVNGVNGTVKATINKGTYSVNATSGTRHALNVSGAAEVTIIDGTFIGPKGTTMDSGAAVNVQSGAKVTIEGGSFTLGKNKTLQGAGTLEVLGGFFDQDPSAYVISSNKAVKKVNGGYEVDDAVASVGDKGYASVLEALRAALDSGASELVILKDVREKMTVDFDLVIKADLTITADHPVKVEFYNEGTSYDFAVGSANSNTLTIGENVHFDLVDRVIWLGYYGNNVDVVVNGYLGGYQIWHGADTTVSATGMLDSHGEAFIMRRDATLTVNGGEVKANYIQAFSGHIVAKDATITAGLVWLQNNHSYGVEGTISVSLDNTTFISNGVFQVKAGEGKTAEIKLTKGSAIVAAGALETLNKVSITADASSSFTAKNASVFVASVNNVKYATLADAIAAVEENGTVTLIADVVGNFAELKNVTLATTVSGGVTLTNTDTENWINMINVTIGSGVTLEMNKAYYTEAGENVIEGTLKVGTLYNAGNSKTIVRNGGKIITTGMIVNRYHDSADFGIFVYGDGDNATVEVFCADTIGTYSGTFYAENAVVESNMFWIDYLKNSSQESDSYAQSKPVFKNSILKVTKELRFYKDATITLVGSSVTAGTVQIREKATPVVSVDNSTIKADAVQNLAGATLNAVLGEGNTVSFKVAGLLGSGTGADPYLIGSVEELIFFRNSVNAGETKYNAPGVYVVLTADIDLDGIDWSVNIGDDCNATFDGIFDGQDHTISNLTSTETAQKGDGYICTGLFGAIYGSAQIKNLIIENVNINVGNYKGNNVGAVVGFAYACDGAIIENVHVVGNINIDAPKAYGVGAIVGYAYYGNSLTIKSCSVSGNDGSAITASSAASGIIGYSSNYGLAVKDCEVEGVALNATAIAGGLAGVVTCGTFENNTVKDVTITVNGENWKNSAAVAVGTLASTSVTVSGTTYSNVNVTDIVGSKYAEQPTSPVAKVQAKVGDKYYVTFDDAFAAAQAGDTITLLADVEASEVILIGKSLTIDGNRHKVTSSATRVFRVTTSNVEVTLKNVNMVSTAVRVGTNDIRGISIDAVDNVKLTLNKCSVDFTDASANDWAYAVNVTGGAGHTVTVNGGTYEGANVINVRGENQTVNVKDATLTSLYPNNDVYYGACIYVVQNKSSSVTATGNTFNGANAVAFNVGYTPVDESDNTDNTTMCVAKIGNTYYTSLAEALTACKDGETVVLLHDIDLGGVEWDPIDFKGNLDGQNHVISNLVVNKPGVSNVGLFSKTSGSEIKNLTIKNAKITGRLNVGVVAGTPWTTKYTNIKVTGHVEVNGMAYVGGVGGKNAYANWTDITVDVDEGSYVKANSVENGTAYRTYVGGVIGFIGEGGHTFQNISSNIKVIGSTCDIGGLFGIAHYGNNFENVTFTGSVEAPAGATEVGGIAGVWNNTQGYTVTFTGVTSTGTVTVGDNKTTGSIVGGAYNANNETPATSGSLIIDGKEAWLCVAKIGDVKFQTLAEALAAAKDGDTITLIWAEGDAPIAMNGAVFGKTVTITGTATVDWSKGNLFIGRGGEGNGTVIFDNANLTSASDSASYGIHVSGREKNTSNKYDGTLVIKNSTIVLDYLINKGTMTLDNSTLTVKNGFSIGGRPASETESGEDATATITLNNGSKVIVNNHNGMGLGYEAIGVMNVNSGSTFKTTQSFLITAKGTLNVNGGTVEVAGKLTNKGSIVFDATGMTAGVVRSIDATVEMSGGTVTAINNNKLVYADVNNDGRIVLVNYVARIDEVYYKTLADALTAAQNGDTVTLLTDVTIAATAGGYNKAGVIISGEILDGNGHTLTVTGANSTWDCGIYITGGTVKNITVKGAFRGIFTAGASADIYLDKVNFKNVVYTFNSDGGNKQYGVYISNSTINGWTSFSDVHKEVVFTNCSFGEGSGYAFCRPYNTTVFNGCTFSERYEIDGSQAQMEFQNMDKESVSALVDGAVAIIARDNDVTTYVSLEAAIAAAKTGNTITILAGTISEGTIKLPATLTNVTIKGAEGAILKDMTISAADGNSYSYIGLTFDGIVFDNSRLIFTGWRNGEETIENLTITNCVFKNLNDSTNTAPVHINKEAAEAVKNFTFTNNVIDGATGGQKSGVYAQLTGEVIFTNNVINNVSFRPYVIQITTDDGIADNFVVTGNTFSGSAVGRAQGLGNNAAGTDTVTLVVSGNIFKGITDAQQICYWNFNPETTDADLSKNYYDIDILNNPGTIYFNSAAQNALDLIEKGVYPYYADEAMTEEVTAPSIMVTYPAGNPVYPAGKIEYYENMLEAVPYTTNCPRLEGATITLLNDVSGAGLRFMENGMVFDLNGHTYTITAGTGSQGTNTSGFQIRPEVTTNVIIKNGTIKVAEGAPVVWMFNVYATDFIVENVTVDCTNMAWSYGDSCCVVVSREGDNVQLIGSTKIENFNAEVAGVAYNIGGTMTVGESVTLGGAVKLSVGATLTAPENLDIATTDGYMVVYANGVYSVVKIVAMIGNVPYADLAKAFAAAVNGDKVEIMVAGTYKVPAGKNITITGAVDGVVFDNIGAHNMGGANVTFNKVTFNYAANSMYKGLQHAGELVYNNCTFNGQVFLYGASETFNNCTFNNTGDNYNVWTYGAKEVVFNGCTFNCAGKSVLIYAESASITNDVTITNSTFNASAAVDGKAAIEMDSSRIAGINLTIDAATTATGFGKGNVSGNSLWNNKKGNNTDANNDITVVVNGETVLAPVTFVAYIGEVGYTDLAKAIAAITDGTTLTILEGTYDAALVINKKDVTVIGIGDVTLNGVPSIKGTNYKVENIDFVYSTGSTNLSGSGLIKDCTFTATGNAFRYCYGTKDAAITFEGCTLNAPNGWAIHFDSAPGMKLTLTDCEINGRVALGGDLGALTATGTTFENGYVNVWGTVSGATFTKCKFVDIPYLFTGYDADNTFNFNDCTVIANGVVKNVTDVIYGGNDAAAAEIYVDRVLKSGVAKIGDTYYKTLEEAFAAAAEGDTIILLKDATPALKSQRAITKASVIDLNGKTLTLTEDDLYFGSIEFKNGTIVVDPSVKVSTAVFWMFENQILTFNDVDLVATGVTGTYLIGINGGTATKVELINSSITIANTDVKGLTAVICDNGTGNSVVIDGTAINVANIDGRFYLGGTNGSITVNDSVVTLNGVKEGFYLRAGQKLSIEGVSNVDIVLNKTEGRYGINLTDATAKYIKADSATVNATSNSVAQIGATYYATLADALAAVKNGETITLLVDCAEDVTVVQTPDVEFTIDGNGKTYSGTITVDGKSAAYATAGLTIKNVNFNATNISAEACINLGVKGNNNTRYTSNVTVIGCTFTGTDCTKVAVKNYTGGCKNLTVKNSSATGMHSLIQVKGVAGLTVENVTIENCKNGISVGTSTGITITKANITATGYGIRVDASVNTTLTIDNSTINAYTPVVVREATASGYAIDFTDTNMTAGNGKYYVVVGKAEYEAGKALPMDAAYAVAITGVDKDKIWQPLEGTGTEKDPYRIENLDDLIFFRDSVNAGDSKYSVEGAYVVLTADIDLASVENWAPIGTFDYSFDGNFNGMGHKIMNLKMSDNTAANGYAYLGFFGVTANNTIENFVIENVTINSNGQIVAAAIAYPYYTTVKDITVCGNIAIKGGNYTAGVLGYTRLCENASNLTVSGNAGSYITGAIAVGGVVADIQMNNGLTANYSNFSVSGLKITGDKCVGGITGIIGAETLNGATVKNVTLVSSDSRVGIVAGSLGTVATIKNVTASNVTGATAIIGGAYNGGAAIQAKIGDTYYATFAYAYAAAQKNDTIVILSDLTITETLVISKDITLDLNNAKLTGMVYPVIRVTGNATVTVTNGYIVNNDYIFVLGASDGSSAGNLIIKDGYYVGETTIASVTKGTLTILGGTFKCLDGEYGSTYLLNCIDANYKNGAEILVKGGTFYGFDPKSNAAEGANTSFMAEGYCTVGAKGVYFVVEHSVEILPAVDPTCTTPGLTKGEKCNHCGTILVKQEEVPAKKHTNVTVTFAASCVENGFTYVYCSDCGMMIEQPKLLPMIPHDYVDGVCTRCQGIGDAVAAIIGIDTVTKYTTLEKAIEAAKNGDVIKLLDNVKISDRILITKTITIDLNGKKLYIGSGTVFTVDATGDLTLTNGTIDGYNQSNGTILNAGGKLTLNDGVSVNTQLQINNISVLHRAGTLVVNGGTYLNRVEIGDTATIYDGVFISEIKVTDDKDLIIYGGSFAQDVTKWCADGYHSVDTDKDGMYVVEKHNFDHVEHVKPTCKDAGYTTYTCVCGDSYTEGYVAATGHTDVVVIPGEDPTCTKAGSTVGVKCDDCGVIIVEPVEIPAKGHIYGNAQYTEATMYADAYITYTCACGASRVETLYGTMLPYVATIGDVRYVTFADAYAAAQAGDTIVLKASVVVTENTVLDLSGLTITTTGDVYPVFRIQNNANVTIKGGKIVNDDYVFVLGASDGSSAGNLTIESGEFYGDTTVASVTKGTLTIKGGYFEAADVGYGLGYTLNCVDANYRDGSAKIVVEGGSFYGFDPMKNAAEGKDTNFVAGGYCTVVENNNYVVVDHLLGDVSGDGRVDTNDLTLLLNYTTVFDDPEHKLDLSAADLNRDGETDFGEIFDAIYYVIGELEKSSV